MFDVNHEEDGEVGILPENLIYLSVVSFERVSSGVPTDELLLLTDLRNDNDTFFIISNIDSW